MNKLTLRSRTRRIGFVLLFAAVLVPISAIRLRAEILVSMTNKWSYRILRAATAQQNWQALDCDDSTWPTVRSVFNSSGYSGDDYAFRTQFSFGGEPEGVQIRLSHIISGGAVFYLNGVELGRFRVPPGTVSPTGFALSAGPTNVILNELILEAPSLRRGTNVLAVLFRWRVSESPNAYAVQRLSFAVSLEDISRDAVRILDQPSDAKVLNGAPVSFSCAASGTGEIHYQWERDGAVLPGRVESVLRIGTVDLADAGVYRAHVWNDHGETWSEPVLLRVFPIQPGQVDPLLNPGFGSLLNDINATVGALCIQKDQRILVAGSFSAVDNHPGFGGIARLLQNGSLDPSFIPAIAAGPVAQNRFLVHAIRELKDGSVVVAGVFSSINGERRALLGWLNADGTLKTNMYLKGPGGALSFDHARRIEDVVELPDGRLLVAGEFSYWYDHKTYASLIRLEADGTLDLSFVPQLPADCGVRTIHPLPGGQLLVGGYSIGYWDATNRVYSGDLIRLSQEGAVDYEFQTFPQLGAIQAIVPAPDGLIYIGGYGAEGPDCQSVVRLKPNGDADPSFGPVRCAQIRTESLAVQPDGNLVINGTMRLHPDATLDDSFDVRAGPQGVDQVVRQVLPVGGHRLLVAGSFILWNNYFSGPLVYLQADPPRPRLDVGVVVDGEVSLSWPNWAAEYQLETCSKVLPGNQEWLPVTGGVQGGATNRPGRNVKAGGTAALYRLVKP